MIKKVWLIKLKKSDEEVTSRSGLILFDEFIKHIKEVARQGYALDNEEYNPGIKCVAVPIRDHTGRVVGESPSPVHLVV